MSAVLKSEGMMIRELRGVDLSAVALIESSSYRFPWSNRIFLDCLAAGYKCRVVEVEARVAGYCIVANVADEVHVLNICIGPDFRRSGCATRLIENEIREAHANKAGSIYLEVRVSNIAAINLYTGLGFKQVGRRRDYYPSEGGREDAFIYSLALKSVKLGVSHLNLYA